MTVSGIARRFGGEDNREADFGFAETGGGTSHRTSLDQLSSAFLSMDDVLACVDVDRLVRLVIVVDRLKEGPAGCPLNVTSLCVASGRPNPNLFRIGLVVLPELCFG